MKRSHTSGLRPAKPKRRPPVPPPPARLDDPGREWVARQLLDGVAPQALQAQLTARGLPPALAAQEVAQAASSPYLHAAERLLGRLGKRDWLLASRAKLDAAAQPDLPRAHALPADRFFAEYYSTNRPVLLTGLVDHWPALARWSLDYIADRLPNAEIEVQTGRESDPEYETKAERRTTRMPLNAVVERLRAGVATNDLYVTARNTGANREALDLLWDDVGPIPGYLTEERTGFFWMGPKGTITPFHHDLTNNLLLQIVGTKRVTLVSAAQTPRMANWHHCYSRLTPADVSPGGADPTKPHAFATHLNPGEILFIPVGWWHHVEGLTTTIGMSFTNFVADNDFHSFYSSYGDM